MLTRPRTILLPLALLFLVISVVACLIINCFYFSGGGHPEKSGAVINDNSELIGRQYDDVKLFQAAIQQSTAAATSSPVSGLILPHHLLAKQLIADTFLVASGGHYQDIVLLSPDHFAAGRTVISVTERNFSTVFGELVSDQPAVKALKRLPFVSEADFFYREHGLQASLPFIKYYFPQARIIAITFRSDSSLEQLDALLDVLEKNLPPETLIVQSTDFSHYLTPAAAVERDAETLTVLKGNQPEKILDLNQPANIDSLAAAYIQAKIQAELFKSHFVLLSHLNSQEYSSVPIVSSTSYLSAVYIK